jgi:hypothetical protein
MHIGASSPYENPPCPFQIRILAVENRIFPVSAVARAGQIGKNAFVQRTFGRKDFE